MNKQLQKHIKNIELQKKAIELRNENRGNYTRKELNVIAKAEGIKYFGKFSKHDLAEKLGIHLLSKRRPHFRAVEICESNVRYPSMIQTAKAYGIFPAQVYTMIARGEARFL